MSEHYPIVVVGAGIMGTAVAARLAERGDAPTVFERFAVGHDLGSSHGATRGLRLGYVDPLYARAAVEASRGWLDWERRLSRPLLSPVMRLEHGDAAWTAELLSSYRLAGIAHEVLAPDVAMSRFAGIRFEGRVLAQPAAAVIAADAAWRSLRQYAEHYGARFCENTAVTQIRARSDSASLRCADGRTVSTDVIIIAAGSWVVEMAGELIDLPPLAVTEEQLPHYKPKIGTLDDPVTTWPNVAHRLDDGRDFWSIATPGLGVKVSFHRNGPIVDPNARVGRADQIIDSISAYVARWMPALDPYPVDVGTCLYTNAPGNEFLLGKRSAVVVVSACSGHGFKFAPVIATAVADLVSTRRRAADVTVLDGFRRWAEARYAQLPPDR
jgi:sarcosine oxidase